MTWLSIFRFLFDVPRGEMPVGSGGVELGLEIERPDSVLLRVLVSGKVSKLSGVSILS